MAYDVAREDVIIPVNAGLASKPGRPRIKGADIRSTVSTYYAPSCNGSIPVITLDDVLSKYDIRDRSVLKLNCQGCEYDVVLNDYEHVRMFEEVIIEYHTGAVVLFRNLSKDLECHILKEINDEQGLMKCISAHSRS